MAAVLVVVGVWAVTTVVEEWYVERSIGDEYRRYQERTPMVLGRPRHTKVQD